MLFGVIPFSLSEHHSSENHFGMIGEFGRKNVHQALFILIEEVSVRPHRRQHEVEVAAVLIVLITLLRALFKFFFLISYWLFFFWGRFNQNINTLL
jgi:hypothetical protein